MHLHLLKSKIHRACITDANVVYEGSLGIDRELMDAVGLLPYERILCTNASNGARFETYAIPAPDGSRDIVLNGAAAHLGKPGDRLTIMSFAEVEAPAVSGWCPRVIVFGAGGRDYVARETALPADVAWDP
jgi:aspartate 1-decarboxylase